MPYDIFYNYRFDDPEEQESVWKFVKSKQVTDSDGFKTEYTWYTDGNKHIFMFGDSDLYEPDEAYADWVCETRASAREWFDTYNGFEEDEDLYECSSAKTTLEVTDKGINNLYNQKSLTEDFNNLPQWFVEYLNNTSRVKAELTRRGVDLRNATYIKAPFPRSNRDPVLRDPTRLNIFKLVDFEGKNHIYIQGVTNPIIWVSSNRWLDVAYLPMKQILEYTEEYGYIDLNDGRNSNKELRDGRAALKHSLTNVRGKGQHPVKYDVRDDNYNVIGSEIRWVTNRGQDKSGYTLNPSKYVDMLNDVGLDMCGTRLKSYYSKIESFRNELIQLVSMFDLNNASKYRIRSMFGNNIYESISNAFREFSSAVDRYQYIKTRVEEIVNDAEIDDERKDRKIKYLFEYDGVKLHGQLKDLRTSIDSIKNAEPNEE